ncbi:MAG: beta-Ala-His dipeptidase [Zoogloeaceae bacterium]|nr:beta-Ala-His dipeptidase [Zoogloeaceae bacterium]
MNPVFSALEPQTVWRHFAMLCETPRASKAEHQVVEKIMAWARSRGIEAKADPSRNLILSAPGRSGRESAPGVILQAHLDMVCQRESGHVHDFSRDPIQPEIEAGWLVARHTTLGADNGIGVALALAALEADMARGPLEVLLTSDEEAGMGGARALSPDALHGRYLLNLDSEEWGVFCLGCAGGARVDAEFSADNLPACPVPPQHITLELKLDGLVGGHSGMDIHQPRANAIRFLCAILPELFAVAPFGLAELSGGTVDNALPRTARAILVLPSGRQEALVHALSPLRDRLCREFPAEADPLLALEPASLPAEMIEEAGWRRLIEAILRLPYGVAAMHDDFPGVVETSNNLAPCHLYPGGGSFSLLVRSLIDSERDRLTGEIKEAIIRAGGRARIQGAYPGWCPDLESELLFRADEAYRQTFSRSPCRSVVHAGLECGLFTEKFPALRMLSFGPDIRGAHAPGERVNIASVGACWQFLTRLLPALAD